MRRILINVLASAALLAVILILADGAALWDRLRTVSSGWIGASVLAVSAATLSMARRWQLVARHVGLELGFGTAVREYYVSVFTNQTVPGGITGDLARAVRARHGADFRTAALSVAVERLLGQVAVFGTLAVGLAAAFVLPGGIGWGPWAWAVPAAALVCAAAVVLAAPGRGAVPRFAALVLALQRRPELAAHAVLTCACLILGFYAAARATGTVIPPEGWATLIPLVLIAMLVPLSVGGWGWREGAAAGLFPLIGAAPEAGIAAGVAYGTAVLVSALPAVLIPLRSGFSVTETQRGPT
ncbi:MAG: lysylphosphatidylglycerol synthase transmembrane domain-containing protein [Pseudomonadota bacterium]